MLIDFYPQMMKDVARFFGPISAFRFHGPRYGRQLPQTYVPIVHNCAKYNVTRQGVYMSLHYGVDLDTRKKKMFQFRLNSDVPKWKSATPWSIAQVPACLARCLCRNRNLPGAANLHFCNQIWVSGSRLEAQRIPEVRDESELGRELGMKTQGCWGCRCCQIWCR